MNVKLLQEVKEYILEEPRRLDMNVLGQLVPDELRTDKASPPCGTVGCIAGWASLLNERERKGEMPAMEDRSYLMDWTHGQDALGLNHRQSQRLFTEPKHAVDCGDAECNAWPQDLARKYVKAKTARQRAKITADRIDRFIESDGAE